MTKQWIREEGGGQPTHVYPINDLMDHKTDGTSCWCNPDIDDGVVVHNAMDRREKYETGELKPS